MGEGRGEGGNRVDHIAVEEEDLSKLTSTERIAYFFLMGNEMCGRLRCS